VVYLLENEKFGITVNTFFFISEHIYNMNPETQQQVIDRAFDISPTSVYGFIVAVLCIAVIVLSAALYAFSKKYIELNISMVQTLSDVKVLWTQTKDDIEKNHGTLHEKLTSFERIIEAKFEFFKNLNK
jgi:hypothetical protein